MDLRAALPRSFYDRPTVEVARALLGMMLVHGKRSGQIVEVEAYPPGDPAAHSSRGRTPRTEVLFGAGGHAYVYLSYGIHECLNVSCEPEGVPGCVLIRGLDFVSGPGRLTRAMGITRAHYGRDLTRGDLRIERGTAPERIVATPRIGITKAVEPLWRFLAG
jgi:DNA-3-methyladenine glycosylase